MNVALSFLLPLVIGYVLVHHALGRSGGWHSSLGKLPLALGLGLGLTGACAFISLALVDHISVGFECALLIGVLWCFGRRPPPPVLSAGSERWTPASRVLVVPLGLLLVASGIAFVIQSGQLNHGGWDAWDFWNMRARFFARGGEHWNNTFSQIPWWTHPEYPVLLPAMVARGFVWVGRELVGVPRALAWVYTVGSVALLYFGVSLTRGRTQGLLAATVLAVTPYFLHHGAEQYADNPLGFYFLATLVCLGLYDRDGRRSLLVLAGAFAGLAAFTKHEGLMFVTCLALARSVVVLRAQGRSEWRRQASAFLLGASPLLALLTLFKLRYAVMPDNAEFYAARWQHWDHSFTDHVLMNLRSGERYLGFFESWWHNLTHFDEWLLPLVFVLSVYAIVQGVSALRPRTTLRTLAVTLALHFLGASAVFLLWSTYDIREHMDATGRLLAQVLPVSLYGVFLTVNTPFTVALQGEPEAAR